MLEKIGTRGSFGVRIDDQDKLTYNHFDSYPSELGVQILEDTRLLMKEGLEEVKFKARNLQSIDRDDVPAIKHIELLKDYTDLEVSTQSTSDYYCLFRNLQGKLAKILKVGLILEDNNFIYDSLFCEYAYILNLDTEKLECYKGFQKENKEKGRYNNVKDDNYYGCALVYEFDIHNLPSKDEFLEIIEDLD